MESEKEKKPLIPVRIIQCILVFLGLLIAHTQMVNVVISIVAMTDRNATDSDAAVYSWDGAVKSYVISSFFWGYAITELPGGIFAQKYGGKIPIGLAVGISSGLAFFTPISATIGDWYLVVALRTVQGFCQGVIYPSVHLFIAQWAPTPEAPSFIGFVYSSISLATVLSLASGGHIASLPLGWPFNFYTTGGCGLIWTVFWFLFSASSPSSHKSISSSEKQYILDNQESSATEGPPPKIPYVEILTSCPVYAGIVVTGCSMYGAIITATYTPTFINSILKFDLKSNGMLSALPYVGYFSFCYVFMYVNDLITRKQWVTVSVLRKTFNSVSQFIPAAALLAVGYLTSEENRNWAVVMFVIVSTCKAAQLYGSVVYAIDMSPNFAGMLMSLFAVVATIVSFVAPLTVGVVVTDEKDPAQWRIIFGIATALYVFGGTVFIVFGRIEIQPWNTPQ